MIPAFEHTMRTMLGSDFEAFQAALSQPAPVSIRLNSRKNYQLPIDIAPVPWHPQGYYLKERPVFTLDPAWHAGAYYVQEASSMVLRAVLDGLDLPPNGLRVLDVCAAPGGKTTLVSDWLGDRGILLSNEVIRQRYGVLAQNVVRWGLPNTALSNLDPEQLGALSGWFDLVLVDAPCSGEGLFRKDPDAASQWSPEAVDVCAGRQKRILAAAGPLLRPGGYLIYSTCTYNEQENEENMVWWAGQSGWEHFPMQAPADWGLVESPWGRRCFPHKMKGEGLFISVWKNTRPLTALAPGKPVTWPFQLVSKKERVSLEAWLDTEKGWEMGKLSRGSLAVWPEHLTPDLQVLLQSVRCEWPFLAGELIRDELNPAHSLALNIARSPAIPVVDFSREEALQYLKKETFGGFSGKGRRLAQYQGLALGWLKLLPNRFNNYLPTDWRIRMDIKKFDLDEQ